MKLDFSKMEQNVLENFKDGTGHLCMKAFSDDAVRIMQCSLEPGASIGLHRHETNSEIVYIISGHAVMICDDVREELAAGCCHYCPKGHTHTLRNESGEPLTFFAVIPQQ